MADKKPVASGKAISGAEFMRRLQEQARKGPIRIVTRAGTFESTLHKRKKDG